MNITDTHCHFDVADFDFDRDDVFEQCHSLGITKIIIPAVESKTWSKVLHLCQSYNGLYPTLGLHPVFINQHHEDDLIKLEKLLDTINPIAIGEIGLDFYIKELSQEKQLNLFEQQLIIAKNHNLPVILHVRKAHDQVIQLLKKIKVEGGFCHAFNGTMQHAEKYLALGFKLGFGGTLTYKNSIKIHKLARELPLEAIVLETDAPDMVVESHRGERNSPAYIVDVLSALAILRDESIEFIAKQTTKNANDIINFQKYDRK